jgi:hypothetical protein
MTVADVLLRRHIETLLTDNARWQTLLADDVMWELPFAPALGHPARVSRRAEVMKFAAWFVEAVENFHFVQSLPACGSVTTMSATGFSYRRHGAPSKPWGWSLSD